MKTDENDCLPFMDDIITRERDGSLRNSVFGKKLRAAIQTLKLIIFLLRNPQL